MNQTPIFKQTFFGKKKKRKKKKLKRQYKDLILESCNLKDEAHESC